MRPTIPFSKTPIIAGSDYDADAQTFFNAGTFNDALKTAYNTFFLNLKTGLTNGTNVFSDTVALYILTSGNAADNAINAKNPGTFDLTFVNSPTHASTGVTFNGSSQYARTGLTPSAALTLNDITCSGYLTQDNAAAEYIMGAANSGTQRVVLTSRWSTDQIFWDCQSSSGGRVTAGSPQVGSELITGARRSATDGEIYRNTASLASSSSGGGTLPTVEMYLGCYNNGGSASGFMANEFKIAMIGNGLTDNQVADWSAAVSQLMTDLGI